MPSTVFFISYRVADAAEQAAQLYNLLANRYRPDWVFRDVKTLEPGQLWPHELKEKVNEAEAVVVLVKDAEKWLGIDENKQRRIDHPDDWVRKEIETALLNKKIIIPVMIDTATLQPFILPNAIAALTNHQTVRIPAASLSDPLYEGGLASLMESLDKIVARYHFKLDELSEAMNMLKRMNLHSSDEQILVLTMAKLASLNREIMNRTLSDEQIKLEKNRIRNNVFYLLDKYA